MKTETTTTTVFTLPSGLELRLTNADPRDVEYLRGIESAVAAEREACASLLSGETELNWIARAIRARGTAGR